MRNEVNFFHGNSEHLLQETRRVLAHNNETIRACGDFLHYDQLVDVGFTKNRMQSCNHRHCELLQESQDVTAGLPSKDPVFVLQAHYIDIAGIKKVSGTSIRKRVALRYLESHPRRVAVPRLRVIHGHHKHSVGSKLKSDSITQICREGRNSTLSRKVVSDNRYSH